LLTILLAAAQPIIAAPADIQVEPSMRMTLQLSEPFASEEERDLLRREYRLSQASGEFWNGFDSLNTRIHGAAGLLRQMRGRIEGTQVVATLPPSLLAGLATTPVVSAPIAAALPQAVPAPAGEAAAAIGMQWAFAAAVLCGLTFLLFRRRQSGRIPAVPAARPVAVAEPVTDALLPPATRETGLKRNTVPLPEAGQPAPVDRMREEMDHALDLAEVMLSYGRRTGAMQTLKDYLRDHPKISVRPWLKLLDLYRQTGMREEFEQAAGTVHAHFNVRVPHWDEGVSDVPLRSFFDEEEQAESLGLEQIPHILAMIQATWPEAACLEYLRHLLADNRGGGRAGFPVPVVAEILLLEDILNDRLAGQA
jgi:hypothetical protein